MTPYEMAYREGEWVQIKANNLIGFIEEAGVVWSVVCVPAATTESKRFNIQNHNMHKIGGSLGADDILALMDIALLPMDEEWLRELCKDYDRQWRREIGITS